MVSGYVLGYGGLLLLGGRAADLLGRRRVFLAALAVFAVASLLGGLVSTGALLIAARLVKGMAAAFTAPAGLSIITTTFAEGPARNRALSIYSAFGAGGFSLGLVLSGLLTEINWRWTLLLPAPVALVILIAGLRLIPRADAPAAAGSGTTPATAPLSPPAGASTCSARSPSPRACCCWCTRWSARRRPAGPRPGRWFPSRPSSPCSAPSSRSSAAAATPSSGWASSDPAR